MPGVKVMSGIERLVPIAIIAAIFAGISPGIIYGIAWVTISIAVIPVVFAVNFPLLILGTKIVTKLKIKPFGQLVLVIPLGIFGALLICAVLGVFLEKGLPTNYLLTQYRFYISLGLIAAIISWALYNFGPLRIESHHSNKAPQSDPPAPRR